MKTILAKQQKSAQIFEFPKNNVLNNSAETVTKDSIKIQESLHQSMGGLTKTDEKLIKANDKLSENVKKLADTIKKQSIISTEKAKSITETATGRRQYRTIGDRIGEFKDKAKDFLTPRGFLDKTGIVKRGTGGFLSDMLDRGEEKKKYVKARMETKGNTFGDEKTFGRQFDDQQKIQRKMVKNESVIKGYEDLGFKDTQIKRSDAFKTRTGLAEDLIKVDTRVRPTKEKDEESTSKSRSQKLLDSSNTSEDDIEAISREETQLELLSKIEENTRPGGIKKLKEPAEKGFLASLLDFFTNKFGSILTSALSMGKTLATGALGVGKSVLGKLGGSGMAGKVLGRTAAVAGGLYEGYTAWNEADSKVKSGEITERQGTVEKGGAVGKGLGTTGGALAGGKLGAIIGTAILPGVGTAVGGLAGGKFGQEIGKMATDGALKLSEGFDEYVKKPFMEFFDGISKMFNDNIVKPLMEFFQPITDFFKNMSTSISDAFTNFSIPEMGVEILGKKFSIGPFFPFKKEVKASKPIPPGNSDAGAGAGSSEFAKTDPRRLDTGKPTSELDAKFDKGMAKARGKIDAVPEGDSVRVQGKLVKAGGAAAESKDQAISTGESKLGPNWRAALKDYDSAYTPADHLKRQYPGIDKKFIELAKKNPPRTDNMQSIEIHEKMLVTKALGEMERGKGNPTSELDAKFDKGMANARDKIAAVPEGDSVRVQGKIVQAEPQVEKKDTLFGKRDVPVSVSSKMSLEQLQNLRGKVEKEGPRTQNEQSKQSHAEKLKTIDMAIEAEKAKSAPGEMKKGTFDKMSAKPTIENPDGTKRLMTPEEISAAKSDMLNKTSMAAPTAASSVYNKSAANAGAAIVPAAAPSNTLIAPTTNVSNNTTNMVRLPARNQDVSLQSYINSRYGT